MSAAIRYPSVEDVIGNTPLVRLARVPGADNEKRGNVILGKLEGNNPAGSVKDRPAISMIRRAEERGDIKPGDTLIEATSGNTGIALAMAAAIRGYRMLLIMPEDLSIERAQTMKAFGAELILTPRSGGMEYARDLAEQMQKDGKASREGADAGTPRSRSCGRRRSGTTSPSGSSGEAARSSARRAVLALEIGCTATRGRKRPTEIGKRSLRARGDMSGGKPAKKPRRNMSSRAAKCIPSLRCFQSEQRK